MFREIENAAYRRLVALNAARSPIDLAAARSNHLEALKKERKGQYSIRIDAQWRICFLWDNHGAGAVEIVDYHD